MNTWINGRWQAATQKDSPNWAARPDGAVVSLIVLHNISLAPFEYGSDAIERLFTNRVDVTADAFFEQLRDVRVSAHFVIRRSGEVQQYVSCDEMAFHAGVSAFHGRPRCNDFSIGIELEGCDFEPFALAQYAALLPLLEALCVRYPIAAITGHQHIAPSRKSDPGHFFDWWRLQEKGLTVDFNVQSAQNHI